MTPPRVTVTEGDSQTRMVAGLAGPRDSGATEVVEAPAWFRPPQPFETGNDVATRHGSYSLLRLRPRAAELADGLRDLVPAAVNVDSMAPAIQSAALVGARFEAAMGALLDAEDAGELKRLDQDARGWARLWFHVLGLLGLTPAGAASLGLDLARAKGEGLRAHVEAKRLAEAEQAAEAKRAADVEGS